MRTDCYERVRASSEHDGVGGWGQEWPGEAQWRVRMESWCRQIPRKQVFLGSAWSVNGQDEAGSMVCLLGEAGVEDRVKGRAGW